MLTFGSLFAGIGGIDLGLERAGMRCVWQVEIDDYATRVLTKHWPDVPKFRDVRSVGAHNLPTVDLIAGGFPCQDISYAGKGAGLSGERSGLWFEFARIIGELRPRYALVENVAALLVRGMGDVLGTLASFGYDAEWHCIPAAVLGAPHRRDRVFILAYARCEHEYTCGELSAGKFAANQTGETSKPGGGRQIISDADGARLAIRQGVPDYPRSQFTPVKRSDWWTIEPDVGRVAYGVPDRVDRLRGLGNAVVPQVAEYIGRCIVEHASQ